MFTFVVLFIYSIFHQRPNNDTNAFPTSQNFCKAIVLAFPLFSGKLIRHYSLLQKSLLCSATCGHNPQKVLLKHVNQQILEY